MAGRLKPGTLCKLTTTTYLLVGEIIAAKEANDGWLHTLYIHHLLRNEDIELMRRRWTE
jgi:hypothetical protein